jgi:DNA-binding response OmpR family regulator
MDAGESQVGKSVLVVDDDEALCAMLEEALVKVGFSVSTAGLEAVAAARPDVIVLDVTMPIMDGFQVLHQLRRDPATQLLPVVMLTARNECGAELEGWMAGADRYLTKPCKVGNVVAAVSEVLDTRSSRQ